MHSDAHLHLVDLADRDPEFGSHRPLQDWRGAVVSHDMREYELSEALRRRMPPTIAGFGIHPQGIRDDTREFLRSLASGQKIEFIGEAGFDFFGDAPERIRTPENLRSQRRIFEFQLELAGDYSLPLLIHSRKSMDVILGYGKELSRLPSVIFHGWPGRLNEANSLLDKGVHAWFSFGTTILRDARHAIESCRGLPAARILSETDAPWQAPRGESWTGLEQILRVEAKIAEVRDSLPQEIVKQLRENFRLAFNTEI